MNCSVCNRYKNIKRTLMETTLNYCIYNSQFCSINAILIIFCENCYLKKRTIFHFRGVYNLFCTVPHPANAHKGTYCHGFLHEFVSMHFDFLFSSEEYTFSKVYSLRKVMRGGAGVMRVLHSELLQYCQCAAEISNLFHCSSE